MYCISGSQSMVLRPAAPANANSQLPISHLLRQKLWGWEQAVFGLPSPVDILMYGKVCRMTAPHNLLENRKDINQRIIPSMSYEVNC